MKRRILGSFLIPLAMMLTLVLSACGDSPTATTAPTTAAATTAAATTAATTAAATTVAVTTAATAAGGVPAVLKMPAQIAGGRPVNITVVGKPLETSPDAVKQWNAQADRFHKLYPNVTL